MSPSYPPRRCAYKPCSNVLSRPKRETSRYCSFDCYMKNIANRPAPKRVHSNAVIIGALEGSKTISAAARSLGYNPENIYARAKRSPRFGSRWKPSAPGRIPNQALQGLHEPGREAFTHLLLDDLLLEASPGRGPTTRIMIELASRRERKTPAG